MSQPEEEAKDTAETKPLEDSQDEPPADAPNEHSVEVQQEPQIEKPQDEQQTEAHKQQSEAHEQQSEDVTVEGAREELPQNETNNVTQDESKDVSLDELQEEEEHEVRENLQEAPQDEPDDETMLQIKHVAVSGSVESIQWDTLQKLLRCRLDSIIEYYQARQDTKESQPDEPNVEKFDLKCSRDEIMELIDSFSEPPFTIQRICELLYSPYKYYNRVSTFLRGLEKNLRVVS